MLRAPIGGFSRLQNAGTLFTMMFIMTSGAFAQTSAPATPPESAAGVPNLVVDPPMWDFGEKWSGEKAETILTIKNTGTAVLKIDQVKSSCGCTVAQAKKKELAPGETEEIKVTYNTKKRVEKVSQKIRIMTNDPDTPTAVFELKGRVKQLVQVDGGGRLDFGPVGMNEAVAKSIEFECTYSKPLKLSLSEKIAPNVDLKLDVLEPGKRYKLTATTKPPLTDGRFSANAVLKTGLEQLPEITIPVSGVAQGLASVSPKVLYVMDGQKESTKTLRVTFRGDAPINVTAVNADLDTIQTNILPAAGDKNSANQNFSTTVIQVKLPPASELPDGKYAVRITTDSPDAGELIVPIRKRPSKAPAAANTSSAPQARPRPGASAPPAEKPSLP